MGMESFFFNIVCENEIIPEDNIINCLKEKFRIDNHYIYKSWLFFKKTMKLHSTYVLEETYLFDVRSNNGLKHWKELKISKI